MLRLSVIISAWAAVVLGAGSPSTRRTSPACRAADAFTLRDIAEIKEMLHSTSGLDSAWVTNAMLPRVADTAIVVVSDSLTCANALTAHLQNVDYSSTELADPLSSTLYVLRLGKSYITANPSFRTGEYVQHLIFDSAFVFQGAFSF